MRIYPDSRSEPKILAPIFSAAKMPAWSSAALGADVAPKEELMRREAVVSRCGMVYNRCRFRSKKEIPV
jgi:hypothetical protein